MSIAVIHPFLIFLLFDDVYAYMCMLTGAGFRPQHAIRGGATDEVGVPANELADRQGHTIWFRS